MASRYSQSVAIVPLAALTLALVPARPAPPGPPPAPQANSQAQPPSEEEFRERSIRLVKNQHADDEALEQFERVERHVVRSSGADGRILDDKTYRVVPTGIGTGKLLIKDGDRPAPPAEYRQQLQSLADALALAARQNDFREKAALSKYEKRKRDRAELVDATREAFTAKWVGREKLNGRDCDVIELTPNPNFRAHSMLLEALTHATAKLWVDHTADQLVRGEAHIIRDVSFGGGILGKLYRGAVFSMDQSEAAPGIWLPNRYQYDYTGRKFLFTFEDHQYTEVSRYRRLGTPKERLAMIESELSSGKSPAGDP
ncbi:MAG TPA: hypothetical protein VEG64_00965 [Candidatus Sulfotelmatobacter sp.]|nr:hypothetical protein [Candidatus Sulfotelmatobacter sp.]